MLTKDIFFQDMENFGVNSSHITKEIQDPQLLEIDRIYSAASGLSAQNAKKYHNTLLYLSIVGGLIALTFLIYDEFDFHGTIFICGLLLIAIYLIHRKANSMEYHKKYLEYRVLAEALRLQFYITSAGIKEDVINLLPWSIKRNIPWITDLLLTLPVDYYNEKVSILDLWIIDQRKYHESALVRTEKQNRRNEIITKGVLYITIFIYIIAILFDAAIFFNLIRGMDFSNIYLILKITIGLMSVVTIVVESYYGKLSLFNKINDHKRMIELYEMAEMEISTHGETEKIIMDLAREFINENSTWYAYQSNNRPGLVI